MSKRARQQGELERLVLDALWDATGPITSTQVLESVDDSSLALTTVLTVLSRLEDKGLVTREVGPGRSHVYAPVTSREQHAAEQLLAIIQGESDQALTLSYFTAGLNKKALASLRKLLNEK